MLLKILISMISVLLMLNLTGCATTKGESAKIQIQKLQNQISDLETQLKQRDEEIHGLEGEIEKQDLMLSARPKTAVEDIGRVSARQIQQALKNAGFYGGSIDGKVGKNTKKSIRAFQEANGLAADGIVGSITWSRLKAYLQ